MAKGERLVAQHVGQVTGGLAREAGWLKQRGGRLR
jgi:hypothetical protein